VTSPAPIQPDRRALAVMLDFSSILGISEEIFIYSLEQLLTDDYSNVRELGKQLACLIQQRGEAEGRSTWQQELKRKFDKRKNLERFYKFGN